MNNSNFTASKKRIFLLVAAIVAVVAVAAGGTFAWFTDSSETKTNAFSNGEVSCKIEETFENGVKSDVKVKNTGTVDAYVRAALVINWVDESGNVYASAPEENSDYTIQLDTENWFEASDGYYYCKNKVVPNSESAVFIIECRQSDSAAAPEGCHLQVKVIASAIQADPDDAVQAAWTSVAVSNGQLS